MKRILLSLMVVTALGASTIAATRAYFSNSQVLGNNTFATGTVKLDQTAMWGLPLNITNLAPNQEKITDVALQYKGTIPAKLYLGAGGTSGPGQKEFLAPYMHLRIDDLDKSTTPFNGLVSELSTAWQHIANNLTTDEIRHYRLTFKLDPTVGNFYQGATNTDTQLMLYAVQQDGDAPTGEPYILLKTGVFPNVAPYLNN